MTFQAQRSYKAKDRQKQEQKPKIKYESMPRLPRDRALAVHQPAMDRGAKCEECPLFGLRAGPVMSVIVPNAQITVLAESPGQNEIDQKVPLVGKSGQVMNEALATGGVAREDCSLINAMSCRPPEELKAFEYRLKVMHETACTTARERGEPEPPAPITPYQACFPRLQKDIEESNSKMVLSMGGAALRAVADYWDIPMGSSKKVKSGEIRISSLKKQIGSPITFKDGTIVVATYHPAFAMRPGSRHYGHVIRKHIIRAAEISRRGKIDWVEPKYILDPSVELIEETLEKMRASGEYVTIDIETDKGTRTDGDFDPFSCRIRCIGFGANLGGTEAGEGDECLICVPIRKMNGEAWWADPTDKKRVLQACMNVLNSNPLVGHNLAFDTQVLLRWGLVTKENESREYDDTMLMHRNTPDCDLPHDLGFVGSRYFEVPSWKSGADDKYYEQVTDYDLHLYNTRDCLSTMRLFRLLTDEIYRHGTTAQYELDKALAPAVRDMGRLGMFVDERKRGELSLKMNQEAFSRLQKLKEIVGDPKFNPSSTPQIRKFLFGKKKHTPVINTKGKDWEEGEDPSTNTIALTKLLSSQACDQQVKDFINTLLEYRAYMKLKGTYIDKLRVTYPDWKKEFGLDVEMLPEVKGPVWRKYKMQERRALLPEAIDLQWRMLSKSEKKQHTDTTPDGVWEEAVVIPARPAISRLFVSFKQHVVSSGRLSSSPNVQNLPKFGKTNTHEMFIAPPGHVMVGADLDQVELRLYAAIARDKILVEAFTKPGPDGKPFDPHSLNAASLFSKKFGKGIIETYLYIVGLPEMYASTFFKGAVAQAIKDGKTSTVTELTPALTKELSAGILSLKANETTEQLSVALKLPREFVDAFLAGWKKGDKEKKKLRGYAKTFCYLECLAEGELVLTCRGELPIEQVTTDDHLWDGHEWVRHSGVIFQGWQDVIEYDGLWATPDHVVWLDNGEKAEFRDAKRFKLRMAKSGAGGHPVLLVDHKFEGLERKGTQESSSTVPVWGGESSLLGQSQSGQESWMQLMFGERGKSSSGVGSQSLRELREANAGVREICHALSRVSGSDERTPKMVVRSDEEYQGSLHEPKKQELEGLRRQRDRIPLCFCGRSGSLDGVKFCSRQVEDNRQSRQRWALRARKSTDDVLREQYQESTVFPPPGRVEVRPSRVAVRRSHREGQTLQGPNKRRNLRAGARDGSDSEGKMVASRSATSKNRLAKTYDILNAGPRHRFTTSGVSTGNCYGGEGDKLYSFMSTARDKATGALMFPDIKEADVLEWHDQWHKNHPETKAWQEACQRVARLEGFTATPIGSYRKRFYPGGSNKPGATFNHVIQGSAAEIANAALLKIARAIPYQKWSPFTGLFTQIHDYIGVVVPIAYAEHAKKVIEDALNQVVFGIAITASAVISSGLATQ